MQPLPWGETPSGGEVPAKGMNGIEPAAGGGPSLVVEAGWEEVVVGWEEVAPVVTLVVVDARCRWVLPDEQAAATVTIATLNTSTDPAFEAVTLRMLKSSGGLTYVPRVQRHHRASAEPSRAVTPTPYRRSTSTDVPFGAQGGPPIVCGMSQLVIRRTSGLAGVLRRISVDVDGSPASARLWVGQTVEVEVPNGQRWVEARMDWARSAPLLVDLSALAAPTTVEVGAPFSPIEMLRRPKTSLTCHIA